MNPLTPRHYVWLWKSPNSIFDNNTRESTFWDRRFSFTEVPGVNTTGHDVTNEVEEK